MRLVLGMLRMLESCCCDTRLGRSKSGSCMIARWVEGGLVGGADRSDPESTERSDDRCSEARVDEGEMDQKEDVFHGKHCLINVLFCADIR